MVELATIVCAFITTLAIVIINSAKFAVMNLCTTDAVHACRSCCAGTTRDTSCAKQTTIASPAHRHSAVLVPARAAESRTADLPHGKVVIVYLCQVQFSSHL